MSCCPPKMSLLLLPGCLLVLVLAVTAAPSKHTVFGKNQGLEYLSRFGYLDKYVGQKREKNKTIAFDTLTKPLRQFQSNTGLKTTGDLDEATVAGMSFPRCGVKDETELATSSRLKRSVRRRFGWRTNNLKYTISKYSDGSLNKEQTDDVIRKAFQVWSDVTPLTFTQVPRRNGNFDINISFQKGKHGHAEPFNKRTLAHATVQPNNKGSYIHFNDEHQWNVKSKFGRIYLLQTAVHEIGHTLGLHHNKRNKNSALYPNVIYNPNFKLASDDIRIIQNLYGKNTDMLPKKPIVRTERPKQTTPNTRPNLSTYIIEGDDYNVILRKLREVLSKNPKEILIRRWKMNN